MAAISAPPDQPNLRSRRIPKVASAGWNRLSSSPIAARSRRFIERRVGIAVNLDGLNQQLSVRVTGPYQAAVSSASAACTASLI